MSAAAAVQLARLVAPREFQLELGLINSSWSSPGAPQVRTCGHISIGARCSHGHLACMSMRERRAVPLRPLRTCYCGNPVVYIAVISLDCHSYFP